MSTRDKEKIAGLLTLIEPHISWRFIGIVVAIPTALIACVTMAGYLFATATFFEGVNYAAKRVPRIDSEFHKNEERLTSVSVALTEVKDTLRIVEGYHFAP